MPTNYKKTVLTLALIMGLVGVLKLNSANDSEKKTRASIKKTHPSPTAAFDRASQSSKDKKNQRRPTSVEDISLETKKHPVPTADEKHVHTDECFESMKNAQETFDSMTEEEREALLPENLEELIAKEAKDFEEKALRELNTYVISKDGESKIPKEVLEEEFSQLIESSQSSIPSPQAQEMSEDGVPL